MINQSKTLRNAERFRAFRLKLETDHCDLSILPREFLAEELSEAREIEADYTRSSNRLHDEDEF